MKLHLARYILLSALLSACEMPATPPSDKQKNALASTDTSSNWDYSTYVDEMTSQRQYFASISAERGGNEGFGYNANPNLVLQRIGGEESVYLELEGASLQTGLFYRSGGDIPLLEVKFDNRKMMYFSGVATDSGDDDAIFIVPTKKFVSYLKRSKTVRIRAMFTFRDPDQVDERIYYSDTKRRSGNAHAQIRAGRTRHYSKILEFKVAGLKWGKPVSKVQRKTKRHSKIIVSHNKRSSDGHQ